MDIPITDKDRLDWHRDYKQNVLNIYTLDGIQRIQTTLSRDLPNDPEDSKRIVLQRIQQLTASDRANLQRAAVGLAKAVQYGVDRYPAIVLNGRLAIYGVTHLSEALHRYQQWQESNTQ